MGARILVVDDDPALRTAVSRALRLEGYEIEVAGDGAEALDILGRSQQEAIILDVTMPRVDGYSVARHLRSDGDRTPILMLTARDEVIDRVSGLDAGADDYLPKPFALEEFLARVRALLRRSAPDGGEDRQLRFDDLVMDLSARTVHRGEDLIDLTRTEFNLLEVLLRNPGQVLSRAVLFERVWGYDLELASNSLDVYIGYLRRKTEADGRSRVLHTVRGIGFVLRC